MDDPVATYIVHPEANQVFYKTEDNTGMVKLTDCTVTDRKNWQCATSDNTNKIQALDSSILMDNETQENKRQITRLEWLQNTILAKFTSYK